jgi:hypothetical protein
VLGLPAMEHAGASSAFSKCSGHGPRPWG